MSELTGWLRREAASEVIEGRFDAAAKLNESADEIERLQKELKELQDKQPELKLAASWANYD